MSLAEECEVNIGNAKAIRDNIEKKVQEINEKWLEIEMLRRDLKESKYLAEISIKHTFLKTEITNY